MGYSIPIMGKSILAKKTSKQSLRVVPEKRHYHYPHEETRKLPQQICKKRFVSRKSLKQVVVASSDSNFNTSQVSPAHTILSFYSAINEKNPKKLEKLIADDCFYEDYSFPKPFQGKKETMKFLQQLTSAMGENTQFSVEKICEGNDYTTGVNWHLEWMKIQVPFTRGCSYYTLSMKEDKLVIKEGRVLVESPVKLGSLALTIFKIMTSLFDVYPAATTRFLKSPHIIFQLVLKSYRLAIRPMTGPFLTWYLKLLSFAAFFLSFTLQILHYLAKIIQL